MWCVQYSNTAKCINYNKTAIEFGNRVWFKGINLKCRNKYYELFKFQPIISFYHHVSFRQQLYVKGYIRKIWIYSCISYWIWSVQIMSCEDKNEGPCSRRYLFISKWMLLFPVWSPVYFFTTKTRRPMSGFLQNIFQG